jgi:hypothetical protein
MTAVRKLQIVHYPETDHMGEDALQRFIAELLRPLIAAWLLTLGRRLFVGADQFIYIVEGDPTQRIAPDIYVLPKVDPDSAPKCWKRWELPEGPSFALEIVSTDYQKDYEDAPVDYARLGTKELVIFDPRVTPRSRKRVRWQVYRRVGKRGFRLVEKSNEDRVYARELKCFLRVVGVGPSTRLRLARGERGDDIVPTAEERLVAELAAQGATLSVQGATLSSREAELALKEAELAARNAELAAQRAEIAQLRAALRRRKPRP